MLNIIGVFVLHGMLLATSVLRKVTSKVCRSSSNSLSNTAALFSPTLAIVIAPTTKSLTPSPFHVCTNAIINNKHSISALIDSGSTDKSFISNQVVKSLKLEKFPDSGAVGMASSSLTSKILGYCMVNLNVQNFEYNNVKLSILNDLCTDVILGTDFQALHDSVIIKYGGEKPSITFCALAQC